MSDAVEIRPVDADAWQVWQEIRLRALQDAPTAFGSTFEREKTYDEALLRQRLGADSPTVMAVADGRPVGMAGGFCDRPGWLLVVSMWVEPGWRGLGIGRRLLDFVVEWADARGLAAHLDVTVGNGAARSLYERYGFVATGETEPLREGSSYHTERMVLRREGQPADVQ